MSGHKVELQIICMLASLRSSYVKPSLESGKTESTDSRKFHLTFYALVDEFECISAAVSQRDMNVVEIRNFLSEESSGAHRASSLGLDACAFITSAADAGG
jgi:hypothetical protein